MLHSRLKNCVMMAYGTSAAGKTHTIEVRAMIASANDRQGNASHPCLTASQGTKLDPGVLPRTMTVLFQVQQLL